MLTSVVIAGKVAEKPEVITTARGNTMASMIVEAARPYRNEDGTQTSDRFRVILWRGIADECADLCSVGTEVVIRGRLQSNNRVIDDVMYYNCEVVAEKVAYRS